MRQPTYNIFNEYQVTDDHVAGSALRQQHCVPAFLVCLHNSAGRK
ncbi:hypothetical protein BKM09_011055 [Pseudomonas amygdali pv. morsprunorum]|nr:hypothetical protein BKM19_028115 [Pseudomonas amygdali pv. morsprunorum]POP86086.1 hypothetical protein CXB39_30060 [Pseudomonas amygdali pv. morsprunorum]POY79327.1 hypothetical protein BKM09_011055 [Pseudomonas amygdali pv. morsprunorum]